MRNKILIMGIIGLFLSFLVGNLGLSYLRSNQVKLSVSIAEAKQEGPAPKKAKDKIVIGQAVSLTGPMAMVHLSVPEQTQQLWIDEVNAKGGIYVKEYGKRLPIVRIQYDDKSDHGMLVKLIEKLII